LWTTTSIRTSKSNPKPEEIRLVIEVSDTTVSFDLTVKAKLYARAGIYEYWVVHVPEQKVIVHREPKGGEYTRLSIHKSQELVEVPGSAIPFCLEKL
jgi:Uma2 family endonuclease